MLESGMQPALRKAFWIGSGLFAAQLAWVVYNTYVPIFLQSGAPDFHASSNLSSYGFGLNATMTGVIMTLDNLAAFFIQPLMGPLSDRTRSRWGRRIPYLMVFVPLAALGLALIPLAPQRISAATNGQFSALGGLFALFLLSLLGTLLAMAAWRTPIFALMADITPSNLRSQANGVLNLLAGVGGVVAFVFGSLLYRLYPPLPFWLAALSLLAALGLMLLKVREPAVPEPAAPEDNQMVSLTTLLNTFRRLPGEHRRPLLLLAAAVFCYMMGFHPIEAFFSSYGVTVLKLSEGDTGLVLASAYVTFIIFAVPAGMLAGRKGRRRTMQAGMLLFALVMLIAFFTPITWAMVILLGLGGLAWALIDVNGLPMILDVSHRNDQAGTYAGIYFAATTLASTTGPILNGMLIDLTGRNYNMIFVIGPFFFILSFLALMGVKTGEAYV